MVIPRAGHGAVLATQETLDLMRLRYGETFDAAQVRLGGLAMRFPRINRLRWDKPPGEAGRLETLERMLEKIETGRGATAAANQGDRMLS